MHDSPCMLYHVQRKKLYHGTYILHDIRGIPSNVTALLLLVSLSSSRSSSNGRSPAHNDHADGEESRQEEHS